MAVRATHARRAHRQTGTSGVPVGRSSATATAPAQAPLTGRDDDVTEAVVVSAAAMVAETTAPTRAAELVMVYGKTLLATRTLQAMGRGGWRGIPRVNVVEFKCDSAPILFAGRSSPPGSRSLLAPPPPARTRPTLRHTSNARNRW